MIDSVSLPLLKVDALIKEYGGQRVVNELNLTLKHGKVLGLLGPNGAGKTTLYSLITRLYNNRSGSIKIYGYDVRDQSSDALKNIGVVFQQPTLDLDLNVEENLYYHSSLHGISKIEAKKRIKREIGRIELEDKLRFKVRSLSGGQRRRVKIARSLLHNPKLLLLDEPTVGLDIGSRQLILKHVKKLCREKKLAVLWATHLIDEIDKGERVVIIHNGKILKSGEVGEIVKDTRTKNIRDAFNKLVKIKL